MPPYKKRSILLSDFYISQLIKNSEMPYLLFIHGGPGLNCGILEYLLIYENLFELLNFNIILYDQRNCGRSEKSLKTITHDDNVSDLKIIINYLVNTCNLNLKGLIGHSYGAKILFDFYNQNKFLLPGIFLSTADSILTPRLNNLILDLSYLKKNNKPMYNEIINGMDVLNLNKLWKISKKLAPLFYENTERPFLYWADPDHHKKISIIQKQIKLPVNEEVFISVRESLYTNEENFSVDITSLSINYLWINGFHDFIMEGQKNLNASNNNIIVFNKSAHYPHIEEPDNFCKVINNFFKS